MPKNSTSCGILWPRILMISGVIAFSLITGVPEATSSTQSMAAQAPDHSHWPPDSVAGVQFWIVGNEEFVWMWEHGRSISIFIEPEALTADNARAIFRHLSEKYPTEDSFSVTILTNDEEVREAERSFGEVLGYPFGNVLPTRTDSGPRGVVSAGYSRSDLHESFQCHSCRGSGQPIFEDLRSTSPDCNVRGAEPVHLLEAVQVGCKDAVEWLLDRGLDPNVKAPHGGVPLMWAALAGNAEIVELLLERGADVNLASSAGWTALIAAAFRRGSGTTIDLLLRKGRRSTCTARTARRH
jgi:hypothetical protein